MVLAAMITIVDVIRDTGIEPHADLSWSVGARVRDLYEKRIGELPPKELRQKTDGSGGSHCFAVYPDDMRAEIEAIIRQHNIELASQLKLEL